MSSSRRRRPRPGAARRPSRVLLTTAAVVGTHTCNRTSATSLTRNKVPMQVTFVFKRPPRPSTLFVHCSDLNSSDPPEIVCSVDDLLLLRVNVGRYGLVSISPEDCDYFIYRADPSRPSLELLQRPHPFFHNSDVGILPLADGRYTVAVLLRTGEPDLFDFHVFHSDNTSSGWSSSILSAAEAPQKPWPVEIPGNCYRLHSHHTTTVITIGSGERGTIGWVVLWRGILFCDVLDSNPALRGVPLPLPLKKMRSNNGLGEELGYPGDTRGISFIRDKGCLKFVHMEVAGTRLPGLDAETESLSFWVDDWELTTWSNKEMSDSFEVWHEDRTVQASNIRIDDPAISHLLEDSGLLRRPRDNAAVEVEQRDLQNLSVYQPTPCATGGDVVYLVARGKFMHPKAWMLAVDMMDQGRLSAVGYFGDLPQNFLSAVYCPSRISKYLHPNKCKDLALLSTNTNSSTE